MQARHVKRKKVKDRDHLLVVFNLLYYSRLRCLVTTGLAAGTVATFTARSAVATVAAVTTLTTGTVATGSTLALYVTFGFGLKGTHRQTVLAGLLVDLDQLHLYLVAFLKSGSLHVLEAIP